MNRLRLIAGRLEVKPVLGDGKVIGLDFYDTAYTELIGPRKGEMFLRYVIRWDGGDKYRTGYGGGFHDLSLPKKLAQLLVLYAYPDHADFIAGIEWDKWDE